MMKTANDKIHYFHSDFIACREAGTLSDLFRCRVRRTPQATAYQQYDEQEKKWISYTWSDMHQQVLRWQTALAASGLETGDRVAIYLKNSIEWVCCEQAALFLRLVVVPIYSLDTAGNIVYVLQDSGAKMLLLQGVEQWQGLASFHADLPDLKLVVLIENNMKENRKRDTLITSLLNWLPEKAEVFPDETRDPHELATIIYTSGTTGKPKGVMLSHRNILSNADAILQVVQAYQEDVFLSFLPLSHTFERTVGYYVPMMAGSQVAFARSVKELGEDLLTIRPTVLISVPRIFERVYGRIFDRLKKKGPVSAKLLSMTVETGWKKFEKQQGRAGACSLCEILLWPLLRRVVAEKVLNRLGGRLRLAVTGGAPLHKKIGQFFIGLGLPLVQGYGLTENSPVVSTNTLENNLPESVGQPLPGIELELGPEKELLVRGPSVMIGYWNLPEEYSAAVDEKGWLRTGDVVEIEDERIYIRNRLKEIIVTSTGEKVPPVNLEMAIAEDPLFFQAMVVGEAKPFLAALVVVDRDGWLDLAGKLSVDPDDPASLNSSAVVSEVLAKIETLLAPFPSYARVRAVHLIRESWTFESGLVTSLMKLKRHKIERHFAAEIASLYKDHVLPE